MSYQRVEKLSETSLQILCGKCVKEARILWSEQAGFDNNHMLLVMCHGEARMVVVDQFQVRIVAREDAPTERLQLTWDSLRDLEDEYLEQLRKNSAEGLQFMQDRLKNLDMFFALKASQEPQKRTTRFEALANELEVVDE